MRTVGGRHLFLFYGARRTESWTVFFVTPYFVNEVDSNTVYVAVTTAVVAESKRI